MIREFDITPEEYQSKKPYPYLFIDNVLNESFAKTLQTEILNLPTDNFDRYDNPFEQKHTLRDKFNYPQNLNKLFEYLQSEEFINYLSKFVDEKLIIDTTRNFHGVHLYDNGDKLDIHLDAGFHPTLKFRKHVTLGIYLSLNWQDEYGGHLEVWDGENANSEKGNLPDIYKLVEKISPNFNRLVLFNCLDNSWHGNPEPVKCPNNAKRIFITISYLSKNEDFLNKRQKALFVKKPDEPIDLEKDKLRFLRCDPLKYINIYRTQNEMN